jgi:transcriptional regulator with XRE-family HTH domain
MPDWCERLRAAVQRSGRKRSALARDAGIAPESLSRVINGHRPNVSFETVVRIAHAAGESVGWVLDERAYALSRQQRERLRSAAKEIEEVTRERE